MPHDPSVMLQSTSISVRRAPTQAWCSSFYIKWPGFCNWQSGDTFGPLGCDGQGYIKSWALWNYNNQRHNSWQPTTHRALYRHQTEIHPQPFWERGLLICPTALALRVLLHAAVWVSQHVGGVLTFFVSSQSSTMGDSWEYSVLLLLLSH